MIAAWRRQARRITSTRSGWHAEGACACGASGPPAPALALSALLRRPLHRHRDQRVGLGGGDRRGHGDRDDPRRQSAPAAERRSGEPDAAALAAAAEGSSRRHRTRERPGSDCPARRRRGGTALPSWPTTSLPPSASAPALAHLAARRALPGARGLIDWGRCTTFRWRWSPAPTARPPHRAAHRRDPAAAAGRAGGKHHDRRHRGRPARSWTPGTTRARAAPAPCCATAASRWRSSKDGVRGGLLRRALPSTRVACRGGHQRRRRPSRRVWGGGSKTSTASPRPSSW